MKRSWLIFGFIFVIALVGCGSNDQTSTTEINDDESNEENSNAEENDDLTLQVLKVDQDEGFTIEDNEFYQVVQAIINADPKMGKANDFSILPLNIVEMEEDRKALLFLAINRSPNPISNIKFELTFGHEDGTYIFEREKVNLTEDYAGVLEVDAAVPFFLYMTEDDEAVFETLTSENIFMEMRRFHAENQ